jgi:hypothetical protein
VAYIGTSKKRWISQTSPHWEFFIDMMSKCIINLNRGISWSYTLQIHNKKSMEKVALTHRTRDKARKANHKTISPSHRKIRVMGRQRRTLENGVSSKKYLGTTLMNVSQNSHCWLRLNKKSHTSNQNLIWSRIRESG